MAAHGYSATVGPAGDSLDASQKMQPGEPNRLDGPPRQPSQLHTDSNSIWSPRSMNGFVHEVSGKGGGSQGSEGERALGWLDGRQCPRGPESAHHDRSTYGAWCPPALLSSNPPLRFSPRTEHPDSRKSPPTPPPEPPP